MARVASTSANDALAAADESTMADGRWLALSAIILIGVLSLVVNPTMPWESDQVTKAAQIVEIANRRDFLLSNDLPDYYRLHLFPLYYSLSGGVQYLVGGDAFRTMNYASAFWGAIAGVALASAFRRTFGIHPLWSTFVLLAMPMFVITFSYGNEIAWALGLFCVSLALVVRAGRASHVAAGVAVAAAVFCRIDVVLMAPFWLGWAILFAPSETNASWWRRLIAPTIGFLAMSAVVWMLIVRQLPINDASATFGHGFNPMLVVAFLSYPFNPSVVLIAAAGWFMLWKRHYKYALVHFLLVIPTAFYFFDLSTPKYVVWMLLFYGLPAALLLQDGRRAVQIAAVGLICIWAVVGISNFGVFGPTQASLWFVPTADGPVPIGGYLDFYRLAHRGDYQIKQQAYIDQTRHLADRGHDPASQYRIVGHWARQTLPYLGASGQLGDASRRQEWEKFSSDSVQLGGDVNDYGQSLLMSLSGYTDLSHTTDEFASQIRDWLAKGQVRAYLPEENEYIPTWIEIGPHVPAGEDLTLGNRLLGFIDHYQNQMVFPQTHFAQPHKSTSWIPRAKAGENGILSPPFYQDDDVAAFDRPIEGAQIFGYPWPEKYFRMKTPKGKHNYKATKQDAPAETAEPK